MPRRTVRRRSSVRRRDKSYEPGRRDRDRDEPAPKLDKVLKEAKKIAAPELERHFIKVASEMAKQNQDRVDMKVFKAVAEFMFKDPVFRKYIEDTMGVSIGFSINVYIRTIAAVIEVIFGAWYLTKGIYRVTMTLGRFIWNIVWYSTIVAIYIIHGAGRVGYVPVWIVKKVMDRRRKTIKQIDIEKVAEEAAPRNRSTGRRRTRRRRSSRRARTTLLISAA
jgi:hypothetical protein